MKPHEDRDQGVRSHGRTFPPNPSCPSCLHVLHVVELMPSTHFLSPLLKKDAPPMAFWVERGGRRLPLATTVEAAVDSASRNRGLLGRDSLAPGHALVIAPSNGIHTFFMRFPIDVIFVARDGRVVKLARAVKPWRIQPRAARVRGDRDGGGGSRWGRARGRRPRRLCGARSNLRSRDRPIGDRSRHRRLAIGRSRPLQPAIHVGDEAGALVSMTRSQMARSPIDRR